MIPHLDPHRKLTQSSHPSLTQPTNGRQVAKVLRSLAILPITSSTPITVSSALLVHVNMNFRAVDVETMRSIRQAVASLQANHYRACNLRKLTAYCLGDRYRLSKNILSIALQVICEANLESEKL